MDKDDGTAACAEAQALAAHKRRMDAMAVGDLGAASQAWLDYYGWYRLARGRWRREEMEE